jgi:hypothetical protein
MEDRGIQLEQNARSKDFDEQSIDLLSKIKSDYEESKIVLDKCKDLLIFFKNTLVDERKI